MKELVYALSEATANRLKSPILGSFLLSWLMINHKPILTFIFSTSEQKIALLNTSTVYWTLEPSLWLCKPMLTIVYPICAALIYTFGLPWIQYNIDEKKFRFVDSKRIKEKHRADRFIFQSQMRTSRVKAQSNPTYWNDRLNRDLDKWDNQRSLLQTELQQTRETRDSLQQQLNSISTIQSNLSAEIENLRKQQHDERQAFSIKETAFENGSKKAYEEVERLNKVLQDYQDQLTSSEVLKDQVQQLRNSINNYEAQLAESDSRYVAAENSIGNLLLVFDNLNSSLLDSKLFSPPKVVNSNTAIEQNILQDVRELINNALEPAREIISVEKEPIAKAKLKQELALQRINTEKQLADVQKSLENLDKSSNGVTNIWE